MDLLIHYRRMMDYERDCTAKVLDSLQRADHALQHGGAAAQAAAWVRAVEIFAHVQAARQAWLSRLGRADWPPDGLHPSWPPDRAAALARQMDQDWAACVQNLSESDLQQVITYRTTEGQECRSTVADILAHLVNHSSYHRGQIATLVAQCGTTPAATDLILFTRTRTGG